MRRLSVPVLLALIAGSAFSQTAENAPRFEIADVHVSPKATGLMTLARGSSTRGGRYQMTNASMVELIARAYGFAPNKVLGGPNWLEMDRFDVVGKIPADTTPDDQKLMLQSLLADRFSLKVHKETKPLPTFALVVAKKPLMKQADGEGETGCKVDSGNPGGPPGEGGGITLNSMGADGKATTIRLGPGFILEYHCRNTSMAAFTEGLRTMMGANAAVGENPLLNETNLEGRWNFDVRWSLGIIGPVMGNAGEHISVSDALEKQLGLKLEPRQVPTPVLVVDSVNRKPTDNPPGVAEALPPIPVPTSFEVADVKTAGPGRMGGFRFMPGGRLSVQGMPMRMILMRAFNAVNDGLVNIPSWVDTERYDITAKAPSADPAAPALNLQSAAPLIRSLLVERFGLKYHEEQRPLPAYTLVAAKPKMKKADPASRTWCKYQNSPPGAPPGSQTIACQNATMSDLADILQNATQELNWPVLDGTGLEGGWDLTLTYSRSFGPMMAMGPGRGGDGGGPGGDLPSASDPTGGVTIFQAIEKQLGLKLELQKRPEPVFVIDHIEQKPTDN